MRTVLRPRGNGGPRGGPYSKHVMKNDLTDDDSREEAAKSFTDAQTAAKSGHFEQAIDLYLAGLELDPDNVDAHRALRSVSLGRKAAGGKDPGPIERMKLSLRKGNPKQDLLNAERLLAYDPGDGNKTFAVLEAAREGGYERTVEWMTGIILQANGRL